jgi:hypothetical protein
MNKVSSLKLLVTATLIAIAAGNAGAEEVTRYMPAAHGTGYVPDWYPPLPDRYRNAQPWSQPSQQPPPAPGYGRGHPYYPAYGQYRPGPGVPVENPLGTELKQTQDQLAAKITELDTMRAQLARLQTELQAAKATLQKAQSDTLNAGRQVDTTRAQVDTLKNILCELAARIESRNTALQNTLKTAATESRDPDSAAAIEVDAETAEKAEAQTDPQCSELTSPPAITSGQRGITVTTQAR